MLGTCHPTPGAPRWPGASRLSPGVRGERAGPCVTERPVPSRSFPVFLTGSIAMATAGRARPPGPPRYTNRLINEKSPYLLQHAHNPVDW